MLKSNFLVNFFASTLLILSILTRSIDASEEKTNIIKEESEKKNTKTFLADCSDVVGSYYICNPLVLLVGVVECEHNTLSELSVVEEEMGRLYHFFADICLYDVHSNFCYSEKKEVCDKLSVADLDSFLTKKYNLLQKKKKYDALIFVFSGPTKGSTKETSCIQLADGTKPFAAIKEMFVRLPIYKFFFQLCDIQENFALTKNIKEELKVRCKLPFITNIFSFLSSHCSVIRDSCQDVAVVNCFFYAYLEEGKSFNSFPDDIRTALIKDIQLKSQVPCYDCIKQSQVKHLKSIRLFLGLPDGLWQRYCYFLKRHNLLGIDSVLAYFEECEEGINMQDKYGRTALHFASRSSYLDIVRCLIKTYNANVHLRDSLFRRTVLHWASGSVHSDKLMFITHAYVQNIEREDKDGRKISKAFDNFCGGGHFAIVKWLITKGGASVKRKDRNGNTALHLASASGYIAIVKLLVTVGKANIDVVDNDGKTALHWAVEGNHLDVVAWLVNKGKANVDIADNSGYTPNYLAKREGWNDMIAFFNALNEH